MHRGHVVMLECIPKRDAQDESEVIWQFLRMTDGDATKFDVTNKSEFIEILEQDADVQGASHVHLSGHGDGDESEFLLPRGRMRPEDFPELCFQGKVVTLSACSLGRKAFIERFCEVTGAAIVIAPTHDVHFAEAAAFFVNYYFLVTHHDMTPRGAFDRASAMVSGKVKGAFNLWS